MQAVQTEKKYNFGNKTQTPLRTEQPMRAEQRQTSQPKRGQGPLKSFKSGAMQVTIWENELLNQDGQIISTKSVTFDRRYKDKNGEWKSTNSLKANDIPKAALLLNKAYEYLVLTGEDNNDENTAPY